MHLHRLLHDRLDLFHHFLEGLLAVPGKVRFKVPPDLQLSILIQEIMSGLQAEHAFKKGLIGGHKLKGEIISKGILIKNLVKPRMFQKGLDLRTEQQRPVHLCIVKGLDPENISGRKQTLLFSVPDRKGIHATQTVQKLFPPLLVSVEQSLRIRIGYEHMPRFRQFFAQLLIIIDLPVEHQHLAFIFII